MVILNLVCKVVFQKIGDEGVEGMYQNFMFVGLVFWEVGGIIDI